ncbi:MAG: 6-bladed beta-propeller [Candidatus Aegiribacteria sp.]|nr:6-bladed beta-propeller [Candidatus Aegiribacteria sp.]
MEIGSLWNSNWRGFMNNRQSFLNTMLLLFLITIPLSFACTGDNTDSDDPDSMDSFMLDTLIVVDSIGVFMGDSTEMFAYITSATPLPDRRFAVLDILTGRISVFTMTGVFQNSFGGMGSGPGEFQGAIHMGLMTNGHLLIQDRMGDEFVVFSQEGEYLYSIPIDPLFSPIDWAIFPCDDSTFVKYSYTREVLNQTIVQEWEIIRCSIENGETQTTYFSNQQNIDEEPLDWLSCYKVVTTGNNGEVYISDCVSDNYEIQVLTTEGDTIRTLRKAATTIPVSDDDVGYIIPLVHLWPDTAHPRNIPGMFPEFRPFVGQMDVDSIGNLWARRGTVNEHIWDVFSPEGEWLGGVFLEGLPINETVELHMNRFGAVATVYEPEDYYRVYIFNDEE